ncbi:MAG: PASTA domain-containing protein [Catenulispora sp.]|nr:PASTA domain-containing protein [Catenulispora sp.]
MEEPTLVDKARMAYRRTKADPRGRMALTAGLVILALVAVVGVWWFGFGRYAPAPNLSGLDRATATQRAQAAGFAIHFGPGRNSETVGRDIVLDQDPPAGNRIVKGSDLTVTLSLGPERYLVPDVVGKTWELASADITALKLKAVKGTSRYDDNAPANTVLATQPPKDTELKPGETVTVILSKGKAPLTVPNVTGQDQAQARATLEGMGLVVAIVYKQSDKPNGQVIDQDPANGAGAEKNQTITLTVSENPNTQQMPDVNNRGCTDGKNYLQSLGYQVQIDSQIGENGWVRDQNPKAGQPVTPGQVVVIKCGVF